MCGIGLDRMKKVIGVRFKKVGKIYYFDPNGEQLELREYVVVETARGVECGEVVLIDKEIDEKQFNIPVKPIIRRATQDDYRQMEENLKKEKEAYDICVQKVKANQLDMNVVDVEYTFDRSKILFYFTADGRVDFRQLVKDLASVFRTRIELRQIGVRDESKLLGGLGLCGRQLCCSLFLGEFEPVSIKMAKEQSLSLNPTKISGTCGRLMCCLKYEQDVYEELLQYTPNPGAVVDTPVGKGTVVYTSILKGLVKVKLDSETEKVLQEFDVSDIVILKDAVRDEMLREEAKEKSREKSKRRDK